MFDYGLQRIRDIHWEVKQGFTYVTDKEQYERNEHWVMPKDPFEVTGDCEDFALACRVLVRNKGLKSRLIFCKTEDGGGHCVLSVGGWILDNRMERVHDYQYMIKIGYRFIAMSGYEEGDTWEWLEH